MLKDLIALKGGAADEQGVLQVHLILLVVALVGKLHESESGELSGGGAGVGHLCGPDFVGGILGHIIGHLGGDPRILRTHDGISGAVTDSGLVGIQGLAHGLPGGGPVIPGLIVPQIDESAGKGHFGIKAEAHDAAVGAALYETVPLCVAGDDGAVGG